MLCVPLAPPVSALVDSTAWPVPLAMFWLSGRVPNEVAPSKNSTSPLGVIAAPVATLAVNVTFCPVVDGFTLVPSAIDVIAFCTLSVKLWSTPVTTFVARKVIGQSWTVPAAGVPVNAVPLNVTPLGSVPDSLNVGAGTPLAVGVNEPGNPTVNVVVLGDVNAGRWFTCRVKL